jgi:hypothetical protein
MDFVSLPVLFIVTIILVYFSMELGYRVGDKYPKNIKEEKEKMASFNATAILSLLGFILVFTFGIVYSRYDSKRELVRDEANMIRTAWLRSDFLPEQDRGEAARLFKRYVDLRIDVTEAHDKELNTKEILRELNDEQYKLWNMAVVNARLDMNSDVAALYIESLNDMFNQQALRIAVGVQARIPMAIWILLYLLVFIGMFAAGYQASISSSSKKSWLTPIMLILFCSLIIIIASLDRPGRGLIIVPQQPIIDLRQWMETSR